MDLSQPISAIIFTWKESLLYATLLHLTYILFIVWSGPKGTFNPAIMMYSIPINAVLTITLILIHTFTLIHFNGGYWAIWAGMFIAFLVAAFVDAFKDEG